MADKPPAPAADAAAGAGAGAGQTATANASSNPNAKGAQNPAFKAMGLPRFRLPSRNWLIFWTVIGSFAGAVSYDKWQTRRNREKWCQLVSHLADETLSTKTMPRRLTVYLAAPPGDGLRAAREHFHEYVKPVLVAAAMDWDVVEGRKEGDVRFKTAERVRRKRKRAGEGEPLTEDTDQSYTVRAIREKSGTLEYDGIAGDIIIGRHTWKEYMRGLHEGWLGPVDLPRQADADTKPEEHAPPPSPAQPSATNAAVETIAQTIAQTDDTRSQPDDASPAATESEEEKKKKEEEKKEEEANKPRNPPPFIEPSEYPNASLSRNTPGVVGPSTAVKFPHLLGIRNTPIRMYRFLTRRRLADDVGKQVAMAILASHRPYATSSLTQDNGGASEVPEQQDVLAYEERDWWKTTYLPRKEHEESVWIEDMFLDSRLTERMQAFQLTAADEDRAKRIAAGTEPKKSEE